MVGPLSAIQPFCHPLTFNFTDIRKLAFRSPWVKYFIPGFVCSQNTAPGISNLHRHSPLRVPNHTLGEMSLRDFISCALRNSRQASVEFEPWTYRSAVGQATTVPMSPAYRNIIVFSLHINLYIFYIQIQLFRSHVINIKYIPNDCTDLQRL